MDVPTGSSICWMDVRRHTSPTPRDYYERTVSLSIVSHAFSQRRLTAQVAVAVNPEADIELVFRDARELGYPADV